MSRVLEAPATAGLGGLGGLGQCGRAESAVTAPGWQWQVQGIRRPRGLMWAPPGGAVALVGAQCPAWDFLAASLLPPSGVVGQGFHLAVSSHEAPSLLREPNGAAREAAAAQAARSSAAAPPFPRREKVRERPPVTGRGRGEDARKQKVPAGHRFAATVERKGREAAPLPPAPHKGLPRLSHPELPGVPDSPREEEGSPVIWSAVRARASLLSVTCAAQQASGGDH
ncbi:hypothetical protein P7K49_018934 [Saguinus oedipus]|uniref:Uncharacterized protein n=1 Tax=Saguinus oedipus TaxID=9490 RepID=A0ABQ9UVW5_SAGOE|nr:hypothetical protein P7K49_018934 [Saguinus oedipus]